MFSIWIIISLGVCCNIPYFLAQHLIGKVVKYRAGIPLAGGNFVTRLAKSYGIFTLRLSHTLTCIGEDELPLSYLESVRVIENMGTHWRISIDK